MVITGICSVHGNVMKININYGSYIHVTLCKNSLLSSTSEGGKSSQGYSTPTNVCIQKVPGISLNRQSLNFPQRPRSPTYDLDHKSSGVAPSLITENTHSRPPKGITTSASGKNPQLSPSSVTGTPHYVWTIDCRTV